METKKSSENLSVDDAGDRSMDNFMEQLKKVPKPGWYSRDPMTGKIRPPTRGHPSKLPHPRQAFSPHMSLIRML